MKTLYEAYPDDFKKPKKSCFKIGDLVKVQLTMGRIEHSGIIKDTGLKTVHAEINQIFPTGAIEIKADMGYIVPHFYIVTPRQIRRIK